MKKFLENNFTNPQDFDTSTYNVWPQTKKSDGVIKAELIPANSIAATALIGGLAH